MTDDDRSAERERCWARSRLTVRRIAPADYRWRDGECSGTPIRPPRPMVCDTRWAVSALRRDSGYTLTRDDARELAAGLYIDTDRIVTVLRDRDMPVGDRVSRAMSMIATHPDVVHAGIDHERERLVSISTRPRRKRITGTIRESLELLKEEKLFVEDEEDGETI